MIDNFHCFLTVGGHFIMSQQFYCDWNHMNVIREFKNYLAIEGMVDVTLVCEGLNLKAHKIILSAFSPFFKSLFLENPCKHPVVILKDIKYTVLKEIIEFMYCGKLNVTQDELSAVIKAAQTLKMKGLGEAKPQNDQSDGELLHQPIYPTPLSNWTLNPQKMSDRSNNRNCELEIEPKKICDDMNCGVLCTNTPTVSIQSCTNPFSKPKHKQAMKQDCALQESFNSAAQNLLGEKLKADSVELNNYIDIVNELRNFLSMEAMVDVTLTCEGLSLKAHKIVLSACSSLFKSLFLDNPCKHSIVILNETKYTDLKAVIEFMYYGKINVTKDRLPAVIKTAQMLKVKGLEEFDFLNYHLSRESENLSSYDSEILLDDKSRNEPSKELENQSDDELSHEAEFAIDVSNWIFTQKQLVKDGGICQSEIKEELLSDADNILHSNVSTATLQSPRINSFCESQIVLLSGDESENQSSSELSHLPVQNTIGHSSRTYKWNHYLDDQSNSGRSHEPMIKCENLSGDIDCSVSYSNTLTMPLQSHNVNPVIRYEKEQIPGQSYDKSFTLQKSVSEDTLEIESIMPLDCNRKDTIKAQSRSAKYFQKMKATDPERYKLHLAKESVRKSRSRSQFSEERKIIEREKNRLRVQKMRERRRAEKEGKDNPNRKSVYKIYAEKKKS